MKKDRLGFPVDEISKKDILALFEEMLERVGEGVTDPFQNKQFCAGTLYGALAFLKGRQLPAYLTDMNTNTRLISIANATARQYAPDLLILARAGGSQ